MFLPENGSGWRKLFDAWENFILKVLWFPLQKSNLGKTVSTENSDNVVYVSNGAIFSAILWALKLIVCLFTQLYISYRSGDKRQKHIGHFNLTTFFRNAHVQKFPISHISQDICKHPLVHKNSTFLSNMTTPFSWQIFTKITVNLVESFSVLFVKIGRSG